MHCLNVFRYFIFSEAMATYMITNCWCDNFAMLLEQNISDVQK